MSPLVLKIGGSLTTSGRHRAVLALAAKARCPIVIVPGGGAHADTVRREQKALGFSDAVAHRRAIGAMETMAAEYMVMQPRLKAAATLEAIRNNWQQGRVPVWLPSRMAGKDTTLPATWATTSDALAARLAERLAEHPPGRMTRAAVVLVKSVKARRSASAAALAAHGVVDPVFAAVIARSGLTWRVISADERQELARLLR